MYVPSRGSNKDTEAGDRKEPARTERKISESRALARSTPTKNEAGELGSGQTV